MTRIRVHNMTMSLDGYAAGPDQDLEHPLGTGGERLHEWLFETATFRRTYGDRTDGPPEEGLDDEFARLGDDEVGATVIGRNMFGPVRGPWPDEEWTGWWGDTPPYHHPVFVVTHHERAPLEMAGGTTFHFVTEGVEAAVEQAVEAAGGLDVRIGGGVQVLRQCLRAGLVDEMHLAIAPVLLGGGERLFDRLDGGPHGMEVAEMVSSSRVTHVRLVRATP